MDNQRPLTPEGFRTAAYLAARARLDARKTNRNVQCTPPNVKCGGRCIPPTWDCRLKGQGTDPHLRAVKTDPLGGLANIQRGIRRISRGIVKGNFSEVEGGKSAIIRGTVKIAPGNLQQKAELKKKLEDRTRAIGIGLAVVTGGLGVHALLMRSSTRYRQGPGLAINNATRSGIGRVLDAVPILGAQRAQNRTAVAENVAASIDRVTQARAVNPAALTANDIPRVTSIASEDYDSHGKLQSVLKAVNDQARGRESGNLTNWDERHRAAFWNATRTEDGLGANAPQRISVFARPSAEEFLASQFGVAPGAAGDRSSLKAAITDHLAEERGNLVRLAKQQGFRVRSEPGGRGESIDSRDLNRFVAGVVRGAPAPDSATRRGVAEHLNRVLTKAPTTYTDELYRDTVLGFDTFYKQNGYNVRQIPGAASNVAENPRMAPGRRLSEGTSDLLRGVDNYRSAFLAREMNIRTEIASPAHAELIRTAYYHTRVVGSANSTFSISDRTALSVASDLAGRAVTSRSEAIQLLNREPGFQGARLVERPAARASTGLRAAASLTALARQIMARQGNEGMTLEAALRAARRERGDADDVSPELVRAATYLAARADFKENPRLGKPCGASHIPKAHECRKEGAAPASTLGSDAKRKAATIAAVAGGALAIAVAGSVAYNLKTLSDPTKSPLTPSPGIKDLVKSMKQEAGTKSASEAMGYYYTKKSGLKPGDVVYFRHEKDPAAHFGIYLGEGKDGVVRAIIANTNSARFSWTDVAEIGATKPGVKTSQALMTPLVKAPAPNFKQSSGSFSNEDVVRRAIRIAGTDYKFSLTKDNCEALANGIAYGVPESEQLQRFRRATRAVVDVGVSRGQRREAREAIYQGRAQGRSYTAREFVTFLEGKREFSSPAGKELAKQYAQYFQNSRLDAVSALNGLISPDELWSRIKSYGPAVKAQAMADYLLIQRSLLELNGPA